MQSSIASARWESMDSASDLDLAKLEEETLRELLFMETKRSALTILAPRRLSNVCGENLEVLGRLKLKMATMTLFLLRLVWLPPCLSLSLMSGLKLTRLLAFLDIVMLIERKGSGWGRRRKRKKGNDERGCREVFIGCRSEGERGKNENFTEVKERKREDLGCDFEMGINRDCLWTYALFKRSWLY